MKRKPRRFKIPRSIKIGRFRWKVFIEPETSTYQKKYLKGKTLEKQNLYGICYRGSVREIHLSKKLKGRKLEMVFMHELMHAISIDCLSARTEEKVIREIAEPIAEVFTRLMRAQKRNRGR